MKFLRQYGLAWLLVLGSFAVVAALWSKMPERIPTHWNAHGQIDGYMDKPWGALIGPLSSLAMVGLLSLLPAVSPEKFSMDPFARVWKILVTALAGFLFVVTAAITLVGAGISIDVTRVIGVAVGALFIVIGNFMGKLTPNFFAGIRTPWTLSNEEVWLRTHRLGAKMFVGSGLLSALATLISPPIGIATILVTSLAAGFVPVIYSYVIFRKLETKTA